MSLIFYGGYGFVSTDGCLKKLKSSKFLPLNFPESRVRLAIYYSFFVFFYFLPSVASLPNRRV
jgi:hypothetical protein